MRTKSYSSAHTPVGLKGIQRSNSKTTFRWQVIPAALSYFVALLMLAVASLTVGGWIEYLQSDRYDANRSLRWTIMETSIIPICMLASLIAFSAAWSWTRKSTTTSLNLCILSVFIFGFAFITRF